MSVALNSTLYIPFIIVLYGHFVAILFSTPPTTPQNLQKVLDGQVFQAFKPRQIFKKKIKQSQNIYNGIPSHFEIGFKLGKDSPRDYNERGRKVFQMGLINMMDVINP